MFEFAAGHAWVWDGTFSLADENVSPKAEMEIQLFRPSHNNPRRSERFHLGHLYSSVDIGKSLVDHLKTERHVLTITGAC